MKKFNIKLVIMAIFTVVLITASIIVYAAFSYKKTVESKDVIIGDVEINNKSFVTYQAKDEDEPYEDSQSYYRLCKLRTDSLIYVEGITITTNYLPVTISSFQPGITYYVFDSETRTYSVAASYQSGTQYFNRIDSIAVKTAFDNTNTLLTSEVSNNVITLKKDTTVVEVLTLTIGDGFITNVGLNDTANHRFVIGSDGQSVYVFSKEKATATQTFDSDTITCYASERKRNDSRIDYNAPYLNQLGLVFEFTTQIPVYVRIHIQDAWISTQFLSSKSERIRYISKDKISGASPFSVTDADWYYDVDNNIAYHKEMLLPKKNATTGEFQSQEYIFNVNEGYFYHDTSAQAASKVTTVQVSFTVDIVQANRAEALWDVDFDELFS